MTANEVPDHAWVSLSVKYSDAQLIDVMKQVRDARTKSGGASKAAFTIQDYDDDPRDLYEIPEVRTFCKRLVRLGFIAEMPDAGDDNLGTLDSLWVWLMSEGLMKSLRVDADASTLARYEQAMATARLTAAWRVAGN